MLRKDREPDERVEKGLPVGPEPRQVQKAGRGMQTVSAARPSQHPDGHVATGRSQQDRAGRTTSQKVSLDAVGRDWRCLPQTAHSQLGHLD